MVDYVKKALKVLDQAFGLPVYLVDGQLQPRLTGKQGIDRLITGYHILCEDQARHGEDAFSNYWLGVLYRYIGKETESQHQMRKALHCDPDFLEAAIAVRDGENYMDPFYYPKWEDLRDGKGEFSPVIMHTQTKTCRIELVRHDSSIIPAVVIKYPETSFRASLSDDTVANVLVNIEAVPPSLSALMQVVPVIFDDIDDPFFCGSYLHLFPVKTELRGIPVYLPTGYRPWLGRDTARRFCQKPCRCALFVLDMQNHVMMTRLIDFSVLETEHFREMDQVLQILGNERIDYPLLKESVDLHDRCYVREIQNPTGEVIRIPKGRDPRNSEILIPQIIRNGDRLRTKWIEEKFDTSQYRRRNDIFISHAHADSKWVCKIREWLERIWPFLRVFQSDPKDAELQTTEPFYFIGKLHRSQCVVFLATPRSIQRSMPESELGAAVDKPVVSLLAGGSTPGDLKKIRDEDLFCTIDLNRVATTDNPAGWKRFAQLLANELQLTLPEKVPDGPVLDTVDVTENMSKDHKSGFLVEFGKFLKNKISGKQTETEAELLLEQLEREHARLAERNGQRIILDMLPLSSLRGRLISLLLCLPNDDGVVTEFIDYFPAIVDIELLRELQYMAEYTSDKDTGMCIRYKWLLEIVRRKLSTY